MAETYSAGIVTAYGAAVRGGYTGTYEDWCRDMAQLGDNVQQVAEDREFVEETAKMFTEQTVPGAVQTVQQAGAAQVTIVQQAGETASQQVTDTGTQQVGRVQIAGAVQIAAAQEQAQAAAESAAAAAASEAEAKRVEERLLPDYTALADEVSDLHSAFDALGLSVVDGAVNQTYDDGN